MGTYIEATFLALWTINSPSQLFNSVGERKKYRQYINERVCLLSNIK